MSWYLNRSTGLILLVLFSVVTAVGILAASAKAGGRVPALMPRNLHRDLSLLTLALLVVHVFTAVTDEYVDIRWWQAIVPWAGSTYQPLWLGFGTLVLDLWAAIAITTALRSHLGRRGWRAVHLLAYASWPVAVAHGIGIGTDYARNSQVALWLTAGSVGLVVAALSYRLLRLVWPGSRPVEVTR